MTTAIDCACDHGLSRAGLSGLLARLYARLVPSRWSADRLDPERLSRHLLRDLGLDEGRGHAPRQFRQD